MKVTVQYFGPAKRFTSNAEKDILELQSTGLSEVFVKIKNKYGIQFVEYIISSCGIVLNEDYLQIEKRDLIGPLNAEDDSVDACIKDIFLGLNVKDMDEIVIVPPVSSG